MRRHCNNLLTWSHGMAQLRIVMQPVDRLSLYSSPVIIANAADSYDAL